MDLLNPGPDRVLLVFSPQGHILVLAGFGNLQGQMEVWDVKKYKQVKKYWRALVGGRWSAALNHKVF